MKTLRILSIAIAGIGIALHTQAMSFENKATMEHTQIEHSIIDLFAAVDAREWENVIAAMAPEVQLDYTSLAGGEPALLSRETIVTSWQSVLPGFQSTHHQVGSFNTTVNGAEATSTFEGLALHYLPGVSAGNTWVVVGTYEYHLVQQADGSWVTDAMTFHLREQVGNLALAQEAQQRVTNGELSATPDVNRKSRQVVERFFTSLENMDIQAFMKVWMDDAHQIMPLSPEGFPRELVGKAAIHNQYKGLPENFTSMRFPRSIAATDDPNTVIVRYQGIIPLKAGGTYANNYVGILEVKDGKLQTFTEYFDPHLLAQAFGTQIHKNFNVSNMKTRAVSFTSQGLVLNGTLHLPTDFDENQSYPAAVVTGSWTTVKEQMPDLYATKLAERGYVALTFDFRTYGTSEGQPRNYEVPEWKAQDIAAAANYLQGLAFVSGDKVNGLGVCASAGYMSQAAAQGAPLQAITLVAPWLHNAALVELIYGGKEGVSERMEKAKQAKNTFAEAGVATYVPAISTTEPEAAMFGEFAYYLDPERGAIPEWGNQFAVMAWEGWLTFDPIQLAPEVQTPIRIVHSQSAAVPQGAEQFYEALPGSKDIIWVPDAIQFDFYDQEPYVSQSADQAVDWFNQHR